MNYLESYSNVKADLRKIARDGDSICTIAKKFPHSQVYTIGATLLITGVAAATVGFCFSAVSIVAASVTVVFIAYNIYQIYQHQQRKKQCANFEPIFNNILSERYELAWQQLQRLLGDSILEKKGELVNLKFIELFPPNLADIVNLPMLDVLGFHSRLLLYTGLMSACSQYKKDDPDLLNTLVEDIRSYGRLMRGGGIPVKYIKQFIHDNLALE